MNINPTQQSIGKLLSSANEQYVIPAYQRRYSWHDRQVWELIDDILLIDQGDSHLLGSIVCLVGHYSAGINTLELVDGQQRLTTITILLECIRQRFEKEDKQKEAASVAQLLIAEPYEGEAVRKIALDSIDSDEFTILAAGPEKDGQVFKNEQLRAAFKIIRNWLDGLQLEEVGKFLYRLRNQSTIIRLDVSEARDAFELFESINNRGLRLSPTDIIKNFLLGNSARFKNDLLPIARKSWSELIEKLDGTNADAFFRYYLMMIFKTRVTASQVVFEFKRHFMNQVLEASTLSDRHVYADGDDDGAAVEADDVELNSDGDAGEIEVVYSVKCSFEDFVAHLVVCAKNYSELVLAKTSSVSINRHLRNLKMIKAAQTYGYLMHLRVGGCSDKNFNEILKLTESFVLRRHICRERANETESLFAHLCAVDPHDAVSKTKEEYRELCPSDDKFSEDFSTGSFPSAVIERARYCLERFELARHGGVQPELQVLGSDAVHVEHIIPQKIKSKKAKNEFGDWVAYLGEKAETWHPKFVSRIGNLTLIAGGLNIAASNTAFINKKKAYKSSELLLTQDILKMSQFKFSDVEVRSKKLASEAVALWPIP